MVLFARDEHTKVRCGSLCVCVALSRRTGVGLRTIQQQSPFYSTNRVLCLFWGTLRVIILLISCWVSWPLGTSLCMHTM